MLTRGETATDGFLHLVHHLAKRVSGTDQLIVRGPLRIAENVVRLFQREQETEAIATADILPRLEIDDDGRVAIGIVQPFFGDFLEIDGLASFDFDLDPLEVVALILRAYDGRFGGQTVESGLGDGFAAELVGIALASLLSVLAVDEAGRIPLAAFVVGLGLALGPDAAPADMDLIRLIVPPRGPELVVLVALVNEDFLFFVTFVP